MADLVVVVPSRGRPEAARALAQHFKSTCAENTFLTFVVDDDDPTRVEYETVGDGRDSGVVFLPSRTMVEALNMAAVSYSKTPDVFAVGFMGDDHCPRTVGWDTAYLAVLRRLGTGIIYGNDLLQGENLPTQCAMTADIIRALGYMAPPELTHLYVDNTWLRWGKSIDRLGYLPDVIVEHRHPVAGKATWDAGYARVNDSAVYERDRAAFEQYERTRFDEDLAKLKALL